MANTYHKIYLQTVFAARYRNAVIDKKWRSQFSNNAMAMIPRQIPPIDRGDGAELYLFNYYQKNNAKFIEAQIHSNR